MGEISRSLKGLARDLDVPVLACSQLSRAPEQRPSHRPILSDLRESGSIEQDADVVAFIYREDVYTTQEEWDKRNPADPYPENIAEIIVFKHRNGPTGNVPLYFRNGVVRFESLDRAMGAREPV
jgi:replicative DNA helicase